MKFFISLFIFIVAYNTTYCQTTNRPDYANVAARETAMMKQKLNLDSNQTEKTTLLNRVFFERLVAARVMKDSLSVRKQKIDQLNQERMASFKNIFTPAQFEKYKADMEAMQAKVREKNVAMRNKQHMVVSRRDSVSIKNQQ